MIILAKTRPTRAEINLDNLIQNLKEIKKKVRGKNFISSKS